jgi:hypothetical protein
LIRRIRSPLVIDAGPDAHALAASYDRFDPDEADEADFVFHDTSRLAESARSLRMDAAFERGREK